MAYFMHRERYIFDEIPKDSIITFPTLVAESFNHAAFRYVPPYDGMDDSEWEDAQHPPTDIVYQESAQILTEANSLEATPFLENTDGSFDIYLPGTYIVCWFISQITGLDSQGHFFCLKRWDYQLNQWIPLSNRGTALKVSASQGCVTFQITLADVASKNPLPGKVTLALFNTSSAPLQMNRTPHLKAGIMIYGFGTIGGEIDDIRQKVIELTNNCCDDGERRARIEALRAKIESLQIKDREQNVAIEELKRLWKETYNEFIHHSFPSNPLPSPTLLGVTVTYIRTGFDFNFFSSGQVNSGGSFNSTTHGSRLYLITAENCPHFDFYNTFPSGSFPNPPFATDNRPATVGCCYIGQASGSGIWWPIYFDENGIYFKLTTTNLVISTGYIVRFNETITLPDYYPEIDTP